jgi:hypothetical protein
VFTFEEISHLGERLSAGVHSCRSALGSILGSEIRILRYQRVRCLVSFLLSWYLPRFIFRLKYGQPMPFHDLEIVTLNDMNLQLMAHAAAR